MYIKNDKSIENEFNNEDEKYSLTQTEKKVLLEGTSNAIAKIKSKKQIPVIQDKRVVAKLLNDISELNYCNLGENESRTKQLLLNIATSISCERGVSVPEIELAQVDKDSKLTGFSNSSAIMKIYYTKGYSNNSNYVSKTFSDKPKRDFPTLVVTIAHEIQHLYQYSFDSEIFHEKRTDYNYAYIFFLDYFTELCEFVEKNYKQKNGYYVSGDFYYYSPSEVDARIAGCEYLIKSLKNPYITDSVRIEIENYLKYRAISYLHLDNVKEKTRYVITKSLSRFEKVYGEMDKGKEIVSLYNSIQPVIDEYVESLGIYEKNISKRIDLAIKESQAKRNKQVNAEMEKL